MPTYRPHSLPSLAALVSELEVIVESSGELKAAELESAETWFRLPRYADLREPPEQAAVLLADLVAQIERLPDLERKHARLLFRLDEAELRINARRLSIAGVIKTTDSGSARIYRSRYLIARVVFALYQQAIHAIEPDYELDFGFRSVAHAWTVTIEPDDPRKSTYTFTTTARALRPGQRFYVFGADLDGDKLIDADALPGQDGLHRYVGDVAADLTNDEVRLHVVYLGRAYDTGEEVDVSLVRRTEAVTKPIGGGLFFEPRGPDIRRVILRADVPLELVGSYERIDRSERSVLANPRVTPVDRTDDSPMEYDVDPVEEGHQYEIAWTYESS